MQIHRLFEILYLLLDKKQVTAKELASQFEVSSRTIYRDLETLCEAGIPIYTIQGKGGGISLMDSFVLDKALLSEKEQNDLLMSLQSLGASGAVDSGPILSKLAGIFRKPAVNWIEVDFSRWGAAGGEKKKFDLLRTALIESRMIRFTYFDSQGKTTARYVCPVKLFFKSRAWYLQAYALENKSHRTFKINRMFTISICREQFKREELPLLPSADEIQENTWPYTELTIKFSPAVAYRLYDEFDARTVVKRPDGYYEVTAAMPEDSWLYSFILSFGDSAEVLKPERVRSRLKEYLMAMNRLYNENS
ncbi:helix-turn-helix transcriptional regulator [Breznakiella homolactica]|uniref:YafY family transcriptional regulator n=1 Tax=Breznakiella homolactica TaxID=2798577 RepID=A0A7T7XMQ7_9SPIR|nr:YafY family protein [Breznakiella homolactica]QQO09082.1 YafY family transcriptional regulator [Breznakiella homolactica]